MRTGCRIVDSCMTISDTSYTLWVEVYKVLSDTSSAVQCGLSILVLNLVGSKTQGEIYTVSNG